MGARYILCVCVCVCLSTRRHIACTLRVHTTEEAHAGQVILEGKRALVVGYGAVGRRMARACLGMVRASCCVVVFLLKRVEKTAAPLLHLFFFLFF